MHILYKFLDADGSVLYVGKTSQQLSTRLANHRHLDSSCYLKRASIEYAVLSSACDLDIYELYYINKYKPSYNTASKHRDVLTLNLPELVWKEYPIDEENESKDNQDLTCLSFPTNITLTKVAVPFRECDTYPAIRLVRAEQAIGFMQISRHAFSSYTSERIKGSKRIRLVYNKGIEPCVSENELRRYMQVLSAEYATCYTEQAFQELPWITTDDYMFNPLSDYIALKASISRATATKLVEAMDKGIACTVEQVTEKYMFASTGLKQIALLALLPASVKKRLDAYKICAGLNDAKIAYIKLIVDECKDKIPQELYERVISIQ